MSEMTHGSPELGPRFEKVLVYVCQLHARQIRKGMDMPCAAHLFSVAALVLKDGGEDEAIAALLHDAVEDLGGAGTREQIRRHFGERGAAIVDGCTDADTTPKPPWVRAQGAVRGAPSQGATRGSVGVAGG